MILLSLKIVLQILAISIAVLGNGLSYIFSDKRTSKFKSWRKWLFVLSGIFLVGSIIVTIIEGIDSAQKEQESKSQIEKLQNQNDVLQNDIHRAANPVSDITVSYSLSIPLDTPSGIAYHNRIEESIFELSRQNDALKTMGSLFGDNGILARIDIENPAFLSNENQEFPAYVAINVVNLPISFYKNSIPIETLTTNEPDGDLSITVRGMLDNKYMKRNVSQDSSIRLSYELKEQNFSLYVDELSPQPRNQWKNGKITSVPDLSEAQIVIRLIPTGTFNPIADAEIAKIYESVKLQNFTIRMSEGREFNFKQTDLKRYAHQNGGLIYVCQFPKIY